MNKWLCEYVICKLNEFAIEAMNSSRWTKFFNSFYGEKTLAHKIGRQGETSFIFFHSTAGNETYWFSVILFCVMMTRPQNEHFFSILPTWGRKVTFIKNSLPPLLAIWSTTHTLEALLCIRNGVNIEITRCHWDAEFILLRLSEESLTSNNKIMAENNN